MTASNIKSIFLNMTTNFNMALYILKVKPRKKESCHESNSFVHENPVALIP